MAVERSLRCESGRPRLSGGALLMLPTSAPPHRWALVANPPSTFTAGRRNLLGFLRAADQRGYFFGRYHQRTHAFNAAARTCYLPFARRSIGASMISELLRYSSPSTVAAVFLPFLSARSTAARASGCQPASIMREPQSLARRDFSAAVQQRMRDIRVADHSSPPTFSAAIRS